MTEEIRRAAEVLRAGGLVAFPTETVYGLGCDARNRVALRRLYEVKGRPPDHPVIVHLADPAMLDDWALEVPPGARALAARYWPGPLTLVLRRSPLVPDEVTGGRETVGVRVPDEPVAPALLRSFGGGVAAPSANRYGRVSPTSAADVIADLGDDVDLVLDGGPSRVGVESTIVDCAHDTPAILRRGAVSLDAVRDVLGVPVIVRDQGEVAAPGTHPVHYAPRTRVVLVKAGDLAARARRSLAAGRRVGLLAPAATLPSRCPDGLIVLGAPADEDEFARVLYARLREADHHSLDELLVVPPPERGIGAAVTDRLRRAAAGRGEDET